MASLLKVAVTFAVLAVLLYFVRQFFQGPMCHSSARIDGKTVLVTGANTGIGKETARDLVSRGGKVIMACRNMEKCNNAVKEIQESENVDSAKVYAMKLDLASLKSVRQFVSEFKTKENRLHILINNAGVMMTPYGKTEDGFEMQIGVNHFGHFLLTNLLLDTIKQSAPSRIVSLSSSAHYYGDINLDDINYEKRDYSSWKAYGDSKQANVLFTRQLAKELKGTGVTTYSLHPGGIKTDLQRHVVGEDYNFVVDIVHYLTYPFWKDIVHGAQTTICCAVDANLSNDSGKYYSDVAEKTPSSIVQSDDLAQELWDLSIRAVGLNKQSQGTQT